MEKKLDVSRGDVVGRLSCGEKGCGIHQKSVGINIGRDSGMLSEVTQQGGFS